MTDHVMGIADRQFAHEGHGNEADRQLDVTTQRRSTIKAEAGYRRHLLRRESTVGRVGLEPTTGGL
jgi:hypothetical protein